MRRVARLVSAFALAAVFGLPVAASATHQNDAHSSNMRARGESLRAGAITGKPTRDQDANSDLAFWGKYAIQGRYDGFRIIDISKPDKPREVTYYFCRGNQGDITVFGRLLIRSINSPMTDGTCNAEPAANGFEGLQIFDIRDIRNPRYLKSVATDCGSHTQTLVPDLKNDRVLIYVSTSSGSDLPQTPFGNKCFAEAGYQDIVEIPLDNPMAARVLPDKHDLMPSHHCHDIGVILGSKRDLAFCAGRPQLALFDISDPAHPEAMVHWTYVPTAAERTLPNGQPNPDARDLTGWHSAAFTWDGKVMLAGWEPGGGSAPECESDDPAYEKSIYFYETPAAAGQTPRLLGRWVHPRGQDGAAENCTIHNYNVLPIRGRYVLVVGNYQAGTSVVDFTDPANPYEIAFSDPAVLTPASLGGAWSSYWYNGFIYESDITRGLRIYEVKDRAVRGAMRLPYLNPQTQEFTLPGRGGDRDRDNDEDDDDEDDEDDD